MKSSYEATTIKQISTNNQDFSTESDTLFTLIPKKFQILPQESSLFETQKLKLEWKKISYHVKIEKDYKEILKEVSGTANPGELLAIMGSSGSGKTSLLDILAGLRTHSKSKINGSIKLNAKDIKSLDYECYRGYVMKDDFLLPFLTVRETLFFAASLKFGGGKKQVIQKVNSIIGELKLEGIADHIIGNFMYPGISGGEKKRVSLGIELLSDPKILILDEPTSSLDSFTAEIIIDLLLQQAIKGKTVIFTIHQPSFKIFNKLQQLILITDGNIIYQGDAAQSKMYFKNIGLSCPKLTNPSDFYMKITHIVNRYEKTDKEKEVLKKLTESYKENLVCQKNTDNFTQSLYINLSKPRHISWFRKFLLLCHRGFMNNIRNPMATYIRIAFFAVIGLFLSMIFHGVGGKGDLRSAQTVEGIMFLIAMDYVCAGNASKAIDIPCEKGVLIKEISQDLYGIASYIIATFISDIPGHAVSVLISALVLYFWLDFNMAAGKFLIFWLICLISQLMGLTIGLCLGIFFKSPHVALVFASPIVFQFLMFAGFFVKVNKMNEAFGWLQYISPYRWSFQALCTNQFTDFNFDCSIEGINCDPLEVLGFEMPLWLVVVYQLVYIAVCLLLAFLCFKINIKEYKI
ncbi:unnamed protein product [Blepharisma stoltei]|uniref:ABC transporter domain-containing protein n=1 Tax=Blepharisma stoltei TaxID=1481888 RepID=A0AAU9JUI3_9CILI|nr:unnamed protein product [Blepharisma stoltei]